ncbi:hypothetical protein BCR33DRAFT_97059 [Rhizoclosmatium globosum]|uniref:Uncharacterized protein n=1 Tax=Rhizoclosmatium globosum TaxID=329046 RepID=A0A1Y2CKC3_9FUNG|nr:hypothetical protein BCR33DRAFT_97059 [Rhizoclosmatium globosum]|eukprot:ORY47436.1 hypothetical protein BCR33DRAFT_97059 [Rhizoclosmatium globosum]
MTRSHERRYIGLLNMTVDLLPSEKATRRQIVSKMFQTDITLKRGKLLHFFTKLGANSSATISVATHRLAVLDFSTAMAQSLQYDWINLEKPYPPFETGHAGLKDYLLFDGASPTTPLSYSYLNHTIKRHLIAIGKYRPGAVLHIDRLGGSQERVLMGCLAELIEQANWTQGKRNGKKSVFYTSYNEGYPLEFIVVSTDHGVGECREEYSHSYIVEVLSWIKWPLLHLIIVGSGQFIGANVAWLQDPI